MRRLFGVETNKALDIPTKFHTALLNNHLIHFSGSHWVFHEKNEKEILTIIKNK